jgi:predicted ester cyclase
VEPFVALMRRYCLDYTCVHNLAITEEIMRPDYVVHISGVDLVRDDSYRPAVGRVFARFPGLALTVHEMLTNGERLAMRFSEHGVAPDEGGHAAAWGGISTYRWDGRQLTECYVEQDFVSQEQQLMTGTTVPLESPHPDPWLGTTAVARDERAEDVVRGWLEAGDLHAADAVEIDDSWHVGLAAHPLDVVDVAIDDLFSAGDRVAFHVTQRGHYRGGIPGTSDSDIGRETTLPCSGIAHVAEGRVVAVRAITDRLGARARLGAGART